MKGFLDTAMSEASLYDKTLASLAMKQARGSSEECVFLLRAYRSTLERSHYSSLLDSASMRVTRRISSSFKDIPGGQILGASPDYTHRLLDFSLMTETLKSRDALLKKMNEDIEPKEVRDFPKVVDMLREEGVVEPIHFSEDVPVDITKEGVSFPSTRSQRLQMLTRGHTGAVISLGYAALRAYGLLHPTIAELRVGELPVIIDDKDSSDPENQYYLGDVEITEVESFIPKIFKLPGGEEKTTFSIGYGMCFGHNESKAIAMSLLDASLEEPDDSNPLRNEEFVLMHIDSVESTGFISHLKLPHYVTFQSKLDAMRKAQDDSDL